MRRSSMGQLSLTVTGQWTDIRIEYSTYKMYYVNYYLWTIVGKRICP